MGRNCKRPHIKEERKMVRSFSKRRYFLAALLTLMIFVLGLMLGLVIEAKRLAYIQQQAKQQELDFLSLQLQYQYVDQLGQEKNCPAVAKTFDAAIESLEMARTRLESYTQNANINREEFKLLQTDYTLAQIRYWLLAKRTRNLCHTEFAITMYFFSDDKDCPQCNEQSFVLTYLKKRLKDKLLNFVIYEKQNEPMVDILKKTYNITEYPTLIVEDKKFQGFTPKEEILKEVCKKYTSDVEDCQAFS